MTKKIFEYFTYGESGLCKGFFPWVYDRNSGNNPDREMQQSIRFHGDSLKHWSLLEVSSAAINQSQNHSCSYYCRTPFDFIVDNWERLIREQSE